MSSKDSKNDQQNLKQNDLHNEIVKMRYEVVRQRREVPEFIGFRLDEETEKIMENLKNPVLPESNVEEVRSKAKQVMKHSSMYLNSIMGVNIKQRENETTKKLIELNAKLDQHKEFLNILKK